MLRWIQRLEVKRLFVPHWSPYYKHGFVLVSLVLSLWMIGCGNESTPFEQDPKANWMKGPGSRTGRAGDTRPRGPKGGALVHGIEEGYCAEDASGKYSEQPLEFNSDPDEGTGSKGGVDFAEGGGCIARPIKEVLSASQHKTSFEWDRSYLDGDPQLNVDPRVNFFFIVKHGAAGGLAHWTMHWFQSIIQGTLTDPKEIITNYQKVDGIARIEYWHGNIRLYSLGPRMTGFDMRQHVRSPATLEEVKNGLIRRLNNYRTTPADWKYLAP